MDFGEEFGNYVEVALEIHSGRAVVKIPAGGTLIEFPQSFGCRDVKSFGYFTYNHSYPRRPQYRTGYT